MLVNQRICLRGLQKTKKLPAEASTGSAKQPKGPENRGRETEKPNTAADGTVMGGEKQDRRQVDLGLTKLQGGVKSNRNARQWGEGTEATTQKRRKHQRWGFQSPGQAGECGDCMTEEGTELRPEAMAVGNYYFSTSYVHSLMTDL